MGEIRRFCQDKGVENFLNLLALYAGVKDDFSKDKIVLDRIFLTGNTQIRWTSNVLRHYNDVDYELKPDEIEGVLEFLNHDDSDILLKNIAIGSIIAYSLIEHDYETEDFTFIEKWMRLSPCWIMLVAVLMNHLWRCMKNAWAILMGP